MYGSYLGGQAGLALLTDSHGTVARWPFELPNHLKLSFASLFLGLCNENWECKQGQSQ